MSNVHHNADQSGDVADLMGFLDESPSPAHAVESAAERLEGAGFERLAESKDWSSNLRAFVVRGGALVAWSAPDLAESHPFRIIGAHTDSPGLRIKPRPDTGALGWRQLGVEVYGGALLNSWLDRDLGIAGTVIDTDGDTHLVRIHAPLARVPQLAIHLDREVNDRGLVLDKQTHLTPVWGTGTPRPGEFAEFLAEQCDLRGPDAMASWELCLYDLTPAALLGSDYSLIASARLDNQISCWAGIRAITRAQPTSSTAVVALFDHEEVGSESRTGAAGPLLEHVLERLAIASGAGRDAFLAALTTSSCVSADNAHAVHPNYVERHEPNHRAIVNAGPAIKVNSNQRYATSPESAAMFERCCREAGVPVQWFVSRNNMPCGSTIGPITATRLGISTVDVGVPQLSMHSARELCGADDPVHLSTALRAFLAS